MRVAVAYADDGVASVQVCVFDPVLVPELGVQTLNGLYVPKLIYFK